MYLSRLSLPGKYCDAALGNEEWKTCACHADPCEVCPSLFSSPLHRYPPRVANAVDHSSVRTGAGLAGPVPGRGLQVCDGGPERGKGQGRPQQQQLW